MKKIAFLLVITILCSYFMVGCNSNTNTNDTNYNQPTNNEVTLTKENFDDYFTIELDTDIDVTKHGGNYVLGVYVYPTYTGVADVDVSVFSSVPLESYNVTVTLNISPGKVYWNEKTITMNLSSTGSANKSITINTSDEKDILLETDCNTKFYASVISVEGTIKLK